MGWEGNGDGIRMMMVGLLGYGGKGPDEHGVGIKMGG